MCGLREESANVLFSHGEGASKSYERSLRKTAAPLRVNFRKIKGAVCKVEGEYEQNSNSLYLDGFICKSPVYRTTPFGREITDILIAVNRSYNKSDYIPIIAWGRNARFARILKTGDNVRIWGRIQSRDYQKRISEEEAVTRTAYEVSVNRIELVESAAASMKSKDYNFD
ncbi:MAG: single-stranded DNA-binding protein [Oscillospiraceae bacterium]|nr:single-stranded DNA-binding protein [Oscillospiraceae bacterium]